MLLGVVDDATIELGVVTNGMAVETLVGTAELSGSSSVGNGGRLLSTLKVRTKPGNVDVELKFVGSVDITKGGGRGRDDEN